MSRNAKRASCLVVLAAVALLAGASSARAIASSPALAQVSLSTVTGIVLDAYGAAAPGATVTATNTSTNVTYTGVTTAAGAYTITGVPVGNYTIRFELAGFKSVQSTFTLAAGQTSRVDAKLEGQDPAPKPGPKPSLEIYGFTMLDIGYNFGQINPNWTDTMRVTQLPGFEDEFGKDGSYVCGVRQSRLGVRATTHDPARRVVDPVRVRDVRHRCGRRPDHLPPAPRLRPIGQVGRGPVLEPVHGHRRVPQLAGVLGTERHGLLPQRPVALHADPRATPS